MSSLRNGHLQIICSMDKLNILSWNVQGLGGHAFPRLKGLIREDLDTPNVGAIDIPFLQSITCPLIGYGVMVPSCQRDGYILGPNDRSE